METFIMGHIGFRGSKLGERWRDMGECQKECVGYRPSSGRPRGLVTGNRGLVLQPNPLGDNRFMTSSNQPKPTAKGLETRGDATKTCNRGGRVRGAAKKGVFDARWYRIE